MRGRTLYVIPFLMGPAGSPFSKVGIQVTDSVYVVLNMRLMTRMGKIALDHLGDSDDFTRCLHSKADLDMERRFICHYPQDNTIWSVGSGYGGNALLAKKCLALRIASKLGQKEGWLAEHMLIVGVENPDGEITTSAARFRAPAARPILAMLVPPASMKGWKIHTIGDDISWLRVGAGWPALGDQSGSGLFRRRSGNRLEDQSQRHGDGEARHDFHQCRAARGRHGVVGRPR